MMAVMARTETAFRTSTLALERAEKLRAYIGAQQAVNATRSDVVRASIARGLSVLEARSTRPAQKRLRQQEEKEPRDRFAGFDGEADAQVSLRISQDTLDRAEALIDYLTSVSEHLASRSDVLREAMLLGIDEIEKEAK